MTLGSSSFYYGQSMRREDRTFEVKRKFKLKEFSQQFASNQTSLYYINRNIKLGTQEILFLTLISTAIRLILNLRIS